MFKMFCIVFFCLNLGFCLNFSQINNLIQQLDPGLYRIYKNYEDGAVQENVIYKEIE